MVARGLEVHAGGAVGGRGLHGDDAIKMGDKMREKKDFVKSELFSLEGREKGMGDIFLPLLRAVYAYQS